MLTTIALSPGRCSPKPVTEVTVLYTFLEMFESSGYR